MHRGARVHDRAGASWQFSPHGPRYGRKIIDTRFASTARLRVGLIADTHMPGTIPHLWEQVMRAFRDVDCILHAGDLHVADVIDALDEIAPTYVSTGNGDLDVVHPRLQDAWCEHMAGVQVGLVHRFPTPSRASEQKLAKNIARHFELAPDVVVYGHTHLAEVHTVAGRTYINPGSATLPNNQSTRLGTIGLLDIDNGAVAVELLQLTDAGTELVVRHEAPAR